MLCKVFQVLFQLYSQKIDRKPDFNKNQEQFVTINNRKNYHIIINLYLTVNKIFTKLVWDIIVVIIPVYDFNYIFFK